MTSEAKQYTWNEEQMVSHSNASRVAREMHEKAEAAKQDLERTVDEMRGHSFLIGHYREVGRRPVPENVVDLESRTPLPEGERTPVGPRPEFSAMLRKAEQEWEEALNPLPPIEVYFAGEPGHDEAEKALGDVPAWKDGAAVSRLSRLWPTHGAEVLKGERKGVIRDLYPPTREYRFPEGWGESSEGRSARECERKREAEGAVMEMILNGKLSRQEVFNMLQLKSEEIAQWAAAQEKNDVDDGSDTSAL